MAVPNPKINTMKINWHIRVILVCTFLLVSGLAASAQFNRYLVTFKNKNGNPYSLSNPGAYLSQRALERRLRYAIPIDSLDLPVTPAYLDSIRLTPNVSILNASKWLNQVAIFTTDPAAIDHISQLPFVASVSAIAQRMNATQNKFNEPFYPIDPAPVQRTQDAINYGRSNGQIKIHQTDFLHRHGFSGQQMQLALLDGGFFHYQDLPTFDSVRMNNQILGTWDFVANEASVNEDNQHGMQCFSTIAANMPGNFVGQAPHASFYLFRTEDVATEYPIEEHFWAVGTERADSLGVDVCSTSLGYTTFDNGQFNHTYADMNGRTTISARAANIASSRGMLMVIAAGNEGNSSWHFISTPSDADSAFCIGAVDTLGNIGSFSSYGPSSDGQIKPDVAAVGFLAIVANSSNGQPGYSNGTSFACPNMAGVVTCLWQAFTEFPPAIIKESLRASGTRYNNPNDRVGYGIPDAKKAFVLLQRMGYSRQSQITGCGNKLDLRIKCDNSMAIQCWRKLPSDTGFQLIHTYNPAADYDYQSLGFTDDLTAVAASAIQYRYVMQIGTDTTYTLDEFSSNWDGCPQAPTADLVEVLPNPFTGTLQVRTSQTGTSNQIKFILTNEAGQVVFSTSKTQSIAIEWHRFNLNYLAKGVYFLKVYYNDRKVATQKLIRG